MEVATVSIFREQLIERREKLESALATFDETFELRNLIEEVDSALERIEQNAFGVCKVCHETVETDRLMADPLVSVCLGCLTTRERQALEEDLELAARIQQSLLPEKKLKIDGWEICSHYEPASVVSGDYYDLVKAKDESLYFMLGDVSGKGVAASMLMSQLHATFRTLISIDMPLKQILERASRVFCESTLPTHYATLVCGKAASTGEVEIINAGHLPILWFHDGKLKEIKATGLPLGMFCEEKFEATKAQLSQGDMLFLYTDGVTEARDDFGNEFGLERLSKLIHEWDLLELSSLVESSLQSIKKFRNGGAKTDDLTVMTLRWDGLEITNSDFV
jgi:sigma-B regulation protein RsbU (phosphoserine phosphatase)